MRRMLVLALCLLAVACATPPAPQKEEPVKPLSDEEFVQKLSADQAKLGAEQKAAVPPAPMTNAPAVSASKITTVTFEPVYRAAKAVQGATTSGVTYVKFVELMQAFSTEINIAKDHNLTDGDQTLLALYQPAYDAYHDSQTVWSAQVKQGGTVLSGPLSPPGVVEILKAYNVPPVAQLDRFWNLDVALQMIWKEAGERLGSATAVYLGKPPTV